VSVLIISILLLLTDIIHWYYCLLLLTILLLLFWPRPVTDVFKWLCVIDLYSSILDDRPVFVIYSSIILLLSIVLLVMCVSHVIWYCDIDIVCRRIGGIVIIVIVLFSIVVVLFYSAQCRRVIIDVLYCVLLLLQYCGGTKYSMFSIIKYSIVNTIDIVNYSVLTVIFLLIFQ